jgi:hypothetical protein
MIQSGDMNIVQAIAELELRLGTLERAYDSLLIKNYSLTKPTQEEINKFRDAAFADLQKKYPSLGLTRS